jgi:hypothetical protein
MVSDAVWPIGSGCELWGQVYGYQHLGGRNPEHLLVLETCADSVVSLTQLLLPVTVTPKS